MAYKALYRTYRPNSFDEVAGQQHVVKTLQHAVEQNKIAHAYLFCGPRGTGKTSIAKIFAKTINCESTEHKPCLQCDNCVAVAEGSHPDIIEIDAASNNGVEEVRNLIEKVKYAPLKGKYKVYIIDEVHMMTAGAFNALLKTIEEPPEHVIFILATTEPHKVLSTIISRCQRFDFTKVPREEIIGRIHTILEAEKISCEEDVIRIIAQLADGGLRDALSILDQCIAYAEDHIEIHHINEIYGITTIQEKMALFHDIFDKNAVSLLNKIDALLEKGIDIKRLTVDLIELLKESIIFEYTKDATLLHSLNSAEAADLVASKTIAERFIMINLLMETYDKYRSAANVGSYFEVCLLQMLDTSAIPVKSAITEPVHQEPKPVMAQAVSKPVFQQVKPVKPNVSRETSHKPVLEIPDDDTQDYGEDLAQNTYIPEPAPQKAAEQPQMLTGAIKPLENEYILGLLAGATKPEKAIDMNQFQTIQNYLIDFQWAKYASLLKNAQIVGSGTNYIVVSVGNQSVANEINEMDIKNEFHDFVVELLGKNKKIFAISSQQQKQVILEFKDRMINGTLPEPIPIEDVIIKKEVVIEKTQEEVVLDLFGEENIVITEE